MRLFAAVEIDAAARQAAHAAGQELRKRLAGVDARWIPAEDLHVTLWFLGEVPDARVPDVVAALDVPFPVPAFPIGLDGFGVFPPAGPPGVLWIGIRDGAGALARLHAEIGTRLGPLGFEPERRAFSAHLTIARVRVEGRRRSPGEAAIQREISRASFAARTEPIDRVTLFLSRLSPNGPRYEPLLRVPLNG